MAAITRGGDNGGTEGGTFYPPAWYVHALGRLGRLVKCGSNVRCDAPGCGTFFLSMLVIRGRMSRAAHDTVTWTTAIE